MRGGRHRVSALAASASGPDRPNAGAVYASAAGRTELTPAERAALPQRATAFVGRRTEIGALRRLLQHSRLVTVVGPGGAGKTRLATKLATTVAPRFADGAVFVDLSTAGEDILVAEAVATAVAVPFSDRDPLRALVDHLRDRSLLLVLDNCEHLLAACASLAAELLRHCPSVSQLATSRERLNVEGETVWAVPPMSLPTSDAAAAADASDAVQLFVDRARLVRPDFALGEDNVADVVAVCRAVDGIPLGIELAAARLATATPAELTDLLADRLGALVGGARDVADRQRTLRATIAWSHDHLSDEQRVLFRRLAVFAGAQRLDAIRVVCAFAPIAPADVHDLLAQLVDKSVVWARPDGGVTRFGMLVPIRQFAAEQLRDAGELDTVTSRHHEFYARLAAEAWQARRHRGARAELLRLWSDIDDVRAALATSAGAAATMEMAADLFFVWLMHAPNEGFRRLRDAFDRLPDPPPALLARAARVLLACAGQTGDYSMNETLLPRMIAAVARGDVDSERAYQDFQLGFHLERVEGDLPGARDAFRAAVAAFESESPGPDLVLATAELASIERQLGRLDAARRLAGEALERALRIDDLYGTIGAYFHLGWLELDEGNDGAALASFRSGLELLDGNDRLSLAHQIEGVACASTASDPRRAARLFGAAERLREESLARLQQPWQPRVERGMAEAHDALGEPAWTRERTAGRALSVEEVIQAASAPAAPARAGGGLSRREAEVARLVAAGMTNRAIAGKLFLSERTVESHLDHILTKLGFATRSQIAAWVAAGQL